MKGNKDKFQLHILKNRLIDFLELNGFAKIYIGNVVQFVRIQDKIFEHTYIERMQDFVFEFVDSLQVSIANCETMTKPDLENELLNQVKYIFSETFLRSIRVAIFEENRDNKFVAYCYYRNGFVVIDRDGEIILEPYSKLKGNIWREQIIDRDFVYNDLFADSTKVNCDFAKFLFAISNSDVSRYSAICTILGYLMHGFKDPSNPQCVILCDEVLADSPEGGTGKGLVLKALEQVKRVVKIEGKNFKFDKSFVWQRVNLDTQVLAFDDVEKRFEFERLFSLITEGINVEKKNQGEFFIPFSCSPKIVITTNYVIEGIGNSFERRKIEFELAPTFNSDYTPSDLLGRMMFVDWPAEEWQAFDNFCVHLLSAYLQDGIIKTNKINIEKKKLIQMTNEDFVEFIEALDLTQEYKRKILFDRFHLKYPGNEKFVTNKRFFQWIRVWAKLNPKIKDVKDAWDRENDRIIKFIHTS